MAASDTDAAAIDAANIDIEALKARYREERDRRLREDGNDQYVEMAGAFARYLEDPYVEPGFTRDPVIEQVEVLVIGGGFGGLLAGGRLREAGVDSFRIVEKGGDFGGTWYWNRYPGAACDTESYIYLPLLEETGYIPERKYARAPEILAHCRRIANHFNLYPHALFQTVVTELRWLENEGRWRALTSRDDEIYARFVILNGGPLERPKLPGIPGIETFRGHSFHTSRWDYAYTGGDSNGNLTGLRDRRVGIIGTGATAVQCVPHLGEWSKELYVFQRTPSSVDVRNDRPTDPEWVKTLRPGWQRERMDNFTAVVSGADFDVDLVNDGWTDLIGNILLAARRRQKAGEPVEDPQKLIELADFQKMERVRARVDAIVRDRKTAEALKPWYSQFCKRPCFHDEYLPTFNRPNVHLVDTNGRGVERITPQGVVANGQLYELDCLVYATGFEVGTSITRRFGMEVYGRDGVTLSERWKDGAETFHGLFSRGFPNCFIVTPVQSGQSPNFQHMLAEQTRHIAWILQRMRERGAVTVECSQAAQDAWVKTCVDVARARVPYLEACTPGYYNNEGKVGQLRELKNNQYWRGPTVFLRMWEAWRAKGDMDGLEFGYAQRAAAE
ncbi:flavin-containing monooxygenase [Camelimonas abortus]|uniref:Flavin-containing monooxygenase n=1 Tax=Camelimonas abortus TaxID=1017184 RepID=A0ABV7LGM0_9HYPH